ncbi:MAG: hypothetical protein M1832_005010 [Thelocarpon impressellum]|nr:MAG: hypothetical protein M1832_005010 [Thelocarpon impressellum]
MSSSPSSSSESEAEHPQAFRFLDLPGELRHKIYCLHLQTDQVIDLEPKNFRRLAPLLRLLQTCRRVHDEAYPVFYGHHTFRLFPVHARFFHTQRPLLARLSPRYRAAICTLELRLGPGWNSPPNGWAVAPRLGLHDATSVRLLKVFTQCDPEHPIFSGFRKGDGFYTAFCGSLLREIAAEVPSIEEMHFDALPSVARDGPLMSRQVEEARRAQKQITWGPVAKWD